MKSDRSRIKWIDTVRGVGIILVILGHTSTPLKKLIYGFHMPLFFLLSGYLYSQKTISIRAKRFIVPYFILAFINLILQAVLLVVRNQWSNKTIINWLLGIAYSRGTTEWMPCCSPLWYLTAAFIAVIALDMLKKYFSRQKVLVISIACSVLAAILCEKNIPKLPWNMDTALMGLFFIVIGYELKERKIIEKISSMQICLCAIVGINAILLNPIEYVNFDDNRYGNYLMMIIGAVSMSLVIIFITKRMVEKNEDLRIVACLQFFWKTYYIFAWI